VQVDVADVEARQLGRPLREGRDEKPGALLLTQDGYRLHRLTVNGIVRKARARASVPASSHCLRHSYATHLLRNGASLPAIAALLGHSSLSSAEIYLRVEIGDLDRMIERSHPREREPEERE
jgi:site-specific recombinase XerD